MAKSYEEIGYLPSKGTLPKETPTVYGYDFNKGFSCDSVVEGFGSLGFQATNFQLAVNEVNKMIDARSNAFQKTYEEESVYFDYPAARQKTGCTIFLGCTSNMISSGVRESIRFVVEHNMVDCMVITAGGIEEDLMKCFIPSYHGDFNLKGSVLKKEGLCRIGNLLVPTDSYLQLEKFVMPILDQALEEQNADPPVNWTPSKLIHRFGKKINNPGSVCYWAYKNDIPIFSPALTDGALGDLMYFHTSKNPGLRLDLMEDVCHIYNMAVDSSKTGMLIMGGGIIKHHICLANCMGDGADYAVYINTGYDFEGSDSGAPPDEAVSWGKIKPEATPVKVFCEGTMAFPLLVSQTFAKQHHKGKAKEEK